MSVYIVNRVKLNDTGLIVEVGAVQVDPQTREPIGKPMMLQAHEAASLILQDHILQSVILVGGHTVLGPCFEYIQYGNGHEGIKMLPDENYTVKDLVIDSNDQAND